MARVPVILLAEDDPNDALLVKLAFERSPSGIRLITVYNGLEAILYLRGQEQYSDRQTYPFPQLVLLDLKMPLMDGFEFLRWIRAEPALRRIPIIVLTNSPRQADARQAYDLGANSYLVKPQEFHHLVEAMRDVGDFWLNTARLPQGGPPN